MFKHKRPTLAVFKFTSCDGCQLSLLDCEDEILQLADKVEIAYFLEASSKKLKGPFDLTIVEGSITTPSENERIQRIREQSRYLITIGACANTGGIQALRNFAQMDEYISMVYASPETIQTLDTSTPISHHVKVDYELNGCPINKKQLLEVINSFLMEKSPSIAHTSVCMECKNNGLPCVLVANNTPCLGPITHAGCDALCPRYHRGCFGCYGPKETANASPLAEWLVQSKLANKKQIKMMLQHINAEAEPFKITSEQYEQE